MVCGTTSAAGKSFLATALARWYARAGYRVAPFKAQNMSNNARVVEGGEIGSAQYFQALAAGCAPDVRMNPLLLKPESDLRSQVILLGERNDALAATEWRARSALVWPTISACLEELLDAFDIVVIEGAGSPAEINLQSTDIVNMRVAEFAAAATLLISDIDRGGAFAHLYGTYHLLPPPHQALIRGFVLNKFRGDAGLLAPGPQQLEGLTGVPTLAVLPMWRGHGLPEEDGVFDAPSGGDGLKVVIVAYPHISNLDEFTPLARVAGIALRWARDAAAVAAADVLILPGSKQTAADLAWLRQTGIAAQIEAHVRTGRPVLAICGGLQMLGTEITDPHGVEGAAAGLGLLPYATEMQAKKRCRRGRYVLGPTAGFWAPLGGVAFEAYEIRHGRTAARTDAGDGPPLVPVLAEECGWQCGATLALYVHGIFESAAVLHALFGRDTPTLEDTLNGLADFIDAGFARGALAGLLEAPRPR